MLPLLIPYFAIGTSQSMQVLYSTLGYFKRGKELIDSVVTCSALHIEVIELRV